MKKSILSLTALAVISTFAASPEIYAGQDMKAQHRQEKEAMKRQKKEAKQKMKQEKRQMKDRHKQEKAQRKQAKRSS